MPKPFTSCCVIIPILLGVLIAILNSDFAIINELLVSNIISKFKSGVFCMELVERNNNIIAYGELPSNIKQGSILTQSSASKICSNIIIVNDFAAVNSGFLRGSIGIGETYFRGQWTYDFSKYDLGDILTQISWNIVNNAGPYTKYLPYFSKNEWIEYFNRIGLTKDQSQDMKDICYTYFDYRFFEKMLDKTMQYTCGVWDYSINNLYDAQINKAEILTHKLNLFTSKDLPSDPEETINILDVGSGWGFLVNFINNKGKQFNVTGITISKDQYENSIKHYGMNNTFHFMDFRDLPNKYPPGYFKRIVSVGVISHIHSIRLNEWFQVLYDMLSPDGYFVMQGIVGTAAFANGNRVWLDINYACQAQNFLTKYIFPGSCALLSDWIHEAAVKAGFIVMHRDYIGQHYVKTLREWRFNIEKNKEYLLDIVSNKRFLSHSIYLAIIEATFRIGKVEKVQYVFYKPKKDNIHKYPYDYGDRVHLSWQ